MNTIRVLHCPTMVGGNPQGLARAERELGLRSRSVVFKDTYFRYKADEILFDPHNQRLTKEVKRWKLLWRALRNYDIIHFNFGLSIFPSLFPWIASGHRSYSAWMYLFYYLYVRLLNMNDIALLRRAGKGIFVTFQGNDARQGDYSLANFEISIAREIGSSYYTAKSDTIKRQIISKWDRYADQIFYLNPDLAYVLPSRAQFLPYGHIDLREWRPAPSVQETVSEKLTVLHAPSHRGTKGTDYVLKAVSRLQSEGVAFNFVLVEGMSHKEARRLYERADLLVDQLLAGWYGGLAVELMALGKPVICYMREEDLKFIPAQMREELPIIKTTPATFYDVLKEWLTIRKHELPEIGRRSRAYVEKWHNPLKIAAKLKDEYEATLASKRKSLITDLIDQPKE